MKRLFTWLMLLLTLAGSVAAKPKYDIYHDFKGKVLLIENIIDNCTERTWYDEQGYKLYTEIVQRGHKESYVAAACHDQNGVQAILKTTTRYVNGDKQIVHDTLCYTPEQRQDYQREYTHSGSLSFENIDSNGNWLRLNVDGNKFMTRRIWYYGANEVNAATPIALKEKLLNSITPKEEAKEVSEDQTATALIPSIIIAIIANIFVGLIIIFAIFFFLKYDSLKEFFNKRAGAKILGRRKIRKDEYIAALGGAILGLLQWVEAMAGEDFISTLTVLALIAIVIYLFRLRKQLLAIAPAQAVRWMLIYKLCTLMFAAMAGALLSIVAIGFIVASMFAKGLDNVWKQEFSFKNPSSDGSTAIRRCGSCHFWDSGHCNFHDIDTPANGGCGA